MRAVIITLMVMYRSAADRYQGSQRTMQVLRQRSVHDTGQVPSPAQLTAVNRKRAVSRVINRSARKLRWRIRVNVNYNALNNIEFIGAGLHGLHIIKLVATSPDIRRGCPNRPVERTCTCALFGPHQYNIILANPLVAPKL